MKASLSISDIALWDKSIDLKLDRWMKANLSISDIALWDKSIDDKLDRWMKASLSISDIALWDKSIDLNLGSLMEAPHSISDITLWDKSKLVVLYGISFGILLSPRYLQSTMTGSFLVELQLQTTGHGETTPTSEITANVAAIRNCIFPRQSQTSSFLLFELEHQYVDYKLFVM